MIRDDKFWLDRACTFLILHFRHKKDKKKVPRFCVYIQQAPQKDGSIKYFVFLDDHSNVLSKTCIDEYLLGKQEEPYFFIIQNSPSSRSRLDIEDTRFDTKEEAYEAFQKIKNAFLNIYLPVSFLNEVEVVE